MRRRCEREGCSALRGVGAPESRCAPLSEFVSSWPGWSRLSTPGRPHRSWKAGTIGDAWMHGSSPCMTVLNWGRAGPSMSISPTAAGRPACAIPGCDALPRDVPSSPCVSRPSGRRCGNTAGEARAPEAAQIAGTRRGRKGCFLHDSPAARRRDKTVKLTVNLILKRATHLAAHLAAPSTRPRAESPRGERRWSQLSRRRSALRSRSTMQREDGKAIAAEPSSWVRVRETVSMVRPR